MKAKTAIKQMKIQPQPAEFKIVRLRECAVKSSVLNDPAELERFWRLHVETAAHFDPERESFWVFFLDGRDNLKGFQQLSQGTRDTALVNVADVFRLASLQSAARLIVAHNHPSGDPAPSEADIHVTHQLIAAAKILQIELLDHVIIGDDLHTPKFASLNASGHFVCRNSSRTRQMDRILYTVHDATDVIKNAARQVELLMSTAIRAENILKKAANSMTAFSKIQKEAAS